MAQSKLEDLHIEGEQGEFFMPSVTMQASTGEVIIQGESYLEDTTEFYEPVMQWLVNYTHQYKAPLTLTIRLTYYNTSSSKSLLELLHLAKAHEDAGNKVQVNWYYFENEWGAKEEAEDFELETNLRFHMIPFTQK